MTKATKNRRANTPAALFVFATLYIYKNSVKLTYHRTRYCTFKKAFSQYVVIITNILGHILSFLTIDKSRRIVYTIYAVKKPP